MPNVESGFIERPCLSSPGTIRLPYRHYRGPKTPRGTCFFFTGGPGMSNLAFTPPASWLNLVDVVVLEYRGVGESTPALQSPYFTRAVLDPIKKLSLSGSGAVADNLARGFADLRAHGVEFSDFGLVNMADDVEALRLKLGLGPVLLAGHSFGTRVAQAMQTRHRHSVHGSLLLGANIAPDGLIWFPEETQAVWRRWLQTEQARNTIGEEVASQLMDGWDRNGRWSTADSRALVVAFFMAFEQEQQLRVLRAMLGARNGKNPMWWFMSRLYSPIIRKTFNWADFFVKGYVIDGNPEAVARADSQGERAVFQSPSSLLFSGLDGFFAAGGSREEQIPTDYTNTLLVSGEFDISTPIERWPDEVPREHKIVLPNAGHADSLSAAQEVGVYWLYQLLKMPPIAD